MPNAMRESSAVHQPKLYEAVAARLREEIVGGELRPGSKLVEIELANEFGVSRGPVREALRQLAHEGLVVDLPRRGTLVATSRLVDLIEVYDVREALESFAIVTAIRKADDDDRARIADRHEKALDNWRHERGEHGDRIAADLAFHREIYVVAGISRMLQIFDQLGTQTSILLRNAMAMNATLQVSPPDDIHQNIIDAILEGDTARAVEAVAAHYRHTRERLFTYVEQEERDGAVADL
jgi:DNA-binding GntR family transcriptional regulator